MRKQFKISFLMIITILIIASTVYASLPCPDLYCSGRIIEEPTGNTKVIKDVYPDGTVIISNYEEIHYHCTECDIEGTYWHLTSQIEI